MEHMKGMMTSKYTHTARLFWLARRGTFVFGGVSYPPVFFCFCFSLAGWFVVLRERLPVWRVGGWADDHKILLSGELGGKWDGVLVYDLAG